MISPDDKTNRKIDINFNIPIVEVIHKLGMKTKGNYFYFSNESQALSINAKKNYAIDNMYNTKYSILELVAKEKNLSIYQSALYLSVYYPEGIRSIRGTGCLDILNNDDFWNIYHIDKKEFLEKTQVSHEECEITGAIPMSKVNYLLGALEGRERDIRKEQEAFLQKFKLEHTTSIKNEDGTIEEIKVNGFHEEDYQYILDTFKKEQKQVETMYQLFASCFRDLVEKNKEPNVFDELEYS